MKKIFPHHLLLSFSLILFYLILSTNAFAQYLPERYQSPIFSQVSEINEVLFSDHVPVANPGGGLYEFITGLPLNVDESDTSLTNLYMDIFQPAGDTVSKRPVVIICFGGGFVAGSKDSTDIRLLAQKLAMQGYVTATIDYRLGMNLFDSELAKRAVYRGIQDGRAAVRFFKASFSDENPYSVDTSNIFIGGHSAGAFIALHNAYLDKESERPSMTFDTLYSGDQLIDLGCLDCAGGNSNFNGQAKSVFSLAGAVGSTGYMESSDDPDVIMFHSQDDGTVPYNIGEPFMELSGLIFGSDLDTVYGSLPITLRADSLDLNYDFRSYTDRGHSVHRSGDSLYSDIIPGISGWFFEQHLKPDSSIIQGDTIICPNDLIQIYSCDFSINHLPKWEIMGGQLLMGDVNSESIIVEWADNSEEKKLSLSIFSCNGAESEKTIRNVEIEEAELNTWIANSGEWNVGMNWSNGHVPLKCQEVLIPANDEPIEVSIATDNFIDILKLELGNNVMLEIGNGAVLEVLEQGM